MVDIKERLEIGKSGFGLVRDVSILGAVMSLFAFPSWTNERLTLAGVAEANLGLVKWSVKARDDALKVGQQIDDLKRKNAELRQSLEMVKASNPSLGAALAPLESQLQKSDQSLQRAENQVVTAVADQQSLLKQVAPTGTAPVGWVYLGKVSKDRSSWIGKASSDANLPITIGSTFNMTNNAYLRANGKKGARSKAQQVGVVRIGQQVRVEHFDDSTWLEKGGGWAVWAQVTIQ